MDLQTTTVSRVLVHSGIALIVVVGLVLLVPLVGGNVSLSRALADGPAAMHQSSDALIFWGTRIPRVLLGLLTGGLLGLAGLIFQAVLKNPLAEPYILGVSGGAAFGKMIAVLLAAHGFASFFALAPLFCFGGAILPLLILYGIGRRTRRFHASSLLLAGVIMNVFFAALILLLQYFSDFAQVRHMFLWSMGALDIVGYEPVAAVLPFALAGVVVVSIQARAMNVLSLDHSTAAHLGVNVGRSLNVLIWSGSILTSAAVAVSGPIGFVGLVVPHALRLVFGPDNRLLVPLSVLYGGVFLVFCDFLGWRGMELLQRAGMPISQTAEIPVGIITALFGGPFFLYLLFTRQQHLDSD